MSARGHALAVMLLVLAVCSAVAATVWLRLDLVERGARSRDRRTDALWLARSAAHAGRSGERTFALGGGTATVRTGREGPRTVAVAEVGGWRARVAAEPGAGGSWLSWEETAEQLRR